MYKSAETVIFQDVSADELPEFFEQLKTLEVYKSVDTLLFR